MNANGLYSGLDGGAVNGVYNGINSGVGNGAVSNETNLLNIPILLLNRFPNAGAAYSLRRLSVNYFGAAIRVRRSSDNVEQDIGFDINGNLNETQLRLFVGVSDGFVSVWYDQSGNGRNATQATQANQPRIALSGVIDRRSGDISLVFDGTNDFMSAANTFMGPISQTSYYCISSRGNNVDQLRTIVSTGILDGTTSGWGLYYTINSAPTNTINNLVAQVRFQPLTNISSIGNIANTINTNTLNFNIITTTSNSIWLNGGNNVTENYSYTNNTWTRDVHIGQNASNAHYLNGTVTEFVIWNTDQSSNRTGIEQNINNYYKIY